MRVKRQPAEDDTLYEYLSNSTQQSRDFPGSGTKHGLDCFLSGVKFFSDQCSFFDRFKCFKRMITGKTSRLLKKFKVFLNRSRKRKVILYIKQLIYEFTYLIFSTILMTYPDIFHEFQSCFRLL